MEACRQNLDEYARPTTRRDVYLVELHAIDLDRLPACIRGRRITALAPHPERADLLYVTTGAPERLAFLPIPYLDLRP